MTNDLEPPARESIYSAHIMGPHGAQLVSVTGSYSVALETAIRVALEETHWPDYREFTYTIRVVKVTR